MKEQNLKFTKLYDGMLEDERLLELSNDGIILYSYMLDRLNLSKSRNYVDGGGKYIILFTEADALKKCRIKQRTFFKLKKQLKELGLIHYDEQIVKKTGFSTQIYVKHYEDWSKEYVKPSVKEVTIDEPQFDHINAIEPHNEEIGNITTETNDAKGFGYYDLDMQPKYKEPIQDRYPKSEVVTFTIKSPFRTG